MTTVVNLSMIEQIIRQKHFMNLKNKYFFKLKDNWEKRYDADDDTSDADEEEEERLRKRRRIEIGLSNPYLLEFSDSPPTLELGEALWYKAIGFDNRYSFK